MTVKIVSLGDKHTRFSAWRVTCGKCETVFTCDSRDVYVVYEAVGLSGGHKSPVIKCECPTCGNVSSPGRFNACCTAWEVLPSHDWPLGMSPDFCMKGWDNSK